LPWTRELFGWLPELESDDSWLHSLPSRLSSLDDILRLKIYALWLFFDFNMSWMNENFIHAFISHDLCQQPVSKVPYLLNFQQAWGSVLVVVGATRMGMPSHCFFKGFKIPFWKKPTTAYHYKDPNPVLIRLSYINQNLFKNPFKPVYETFWMSQVVSLLIHSTLLLN
jgi:hypothetical protein